MTDWCLNLLHITGPEEEVRKFHKLIAKGLDFGLFVPPQDWGMDENAVDFKIEEVEKEELVCRFDTAWEPPLPVIEAMARKFRKLTFTLFFENETDTFEGEFQWHGKNRRILWFRGEGKIAVNDVRIRVEGRKWKMRGKEIDAPLIFANNYGTYVLWGDSYLRMEELMPLLDYLPCQELNFGGTTIRTYNNALLHELCLAVLRLEDGSWEVFQKVEKILRRTGDIKKAEAVMISYLLLEGNHENRPRKTVARGQGNSGVRREGAR